MKIEFAIWVALFASFATIFSSIFGSIIQYKINKSNNEYLLKKAELELNNLSKNKIIENKISNIRKATIELNDAFIELSNKNFKTNLNFWKNYFNAYSVASENTRKYLDDLRKELDIGSFSIQQVKESRLTEIFININKSFCNDIDQLK